MQRLEESGVIPVRLDPSGAALHSVDGTPVDAVVVTETLNGVAVLAYHPEASTQDGLGPALRRDPETAPWDVSRAQSQCEAAGPENRLIADEVRGRNRESKL